MPGDWGRAVVPEPLAGSGSGRMASTLKALASTVVSLAMISIATMWNRCSLCLLSSLAFLKLIKGFVLDKTVDVSVRVR